MTTSRAIAAMTRTAVRTVSPVVTRPLTGLGSPFILLAHADEAAVVLAGQRPEEGADVGALEEEADRDDADAILTGDRAVPLVFELVAQVAGEMLDLFRFGEFVPAGRQAFAGVRQPIGQYVDGIELAGPAVPERLGEHLVHVGLAVGLA